MKHNHEHKHTKLWFSIQIILVIPILADILLVGTGTYNNNNWTVWLIRTFTLMTLTGILVFTFGLKYFKQYKIVLQGKIKMNLLIAIAIHATWIYSFLITFIRWHWFADADKIAPITFWEASGVLIVFMNIGDYIEDKLMHSSSKGLENLLAMQNKFANLMIKGEVIKTLIDELKIGDLVLVKKGESIPIDGIVQEGKGYIDKSSISGEATPESIKKDSLVFSGTINVGESIIIKVNKLSKDSTLNQLITKLENLMKAKPKMQRVASTFIKYFVPLILSLATLTFIFWFTFLSLNDNHLPGFLSFRSNPDNTAFSSAIFASVATLAVSCPCAFGIAAPSIISTSSYITTKNNLLFSSPTVFENVKEIEYILFDKTGTLTKGKPEVVKFIGDQKIADIAASIEKHSSHPLAFAISTYAKDNLKITSLKEASGIGISGKYDKKEYEITSYENAIKNGYKDLDVKIKDSGIKISISQNKKIVGLFLIKDELKKDAKKVLSKVIKMGIKPIMVTGDSLENSQDIANQLGISEIHASLKPEDKLSIVNELKKKGKVMFIGDGLNDVLIIKAADIGIAFASGSNITNSVADISIMNHKLSSLITILTIGKRTLKSIKYNYFWAFAFNICVVPLAMMGLIFPWLSAILMISSNIVLFLNILYFKLSTEKKIKNFLQYN